MVEDSDLDTGRCGVSDGVDEAETAVGVDEEEDKVETGAAVDVRMRRSNFQTSGLDDELTAAFEEVDAAPTTALDDGEAGILDGAAEEDGEDGKFPVDRVENSMLALTLGGATVFVSVFICPSLQ